MIRKKNIFLLLFILVIFVGGVFMVIVQNKPPVVENFKSSDYQYYIDNFPSEENVDSIIDAKDAIKKAEIIWIKLYGENIKKEKRGFFSKFSK